MHEDYAIHIVDDDEAVRDAVGQLVESVGLRSVGYASAEEFIDGLDAIDRGVLVLDVRMSGMGGLELQDWLLEKSVQLPIVVISGHGDIPMAVEAIQKGAVDFIEKPFRNQTLLDRIRKAIKTDEENRKSLDELNRLEMYYSLLTDREKEVCDYILQGMQSKEIAREMAVSYRTIEGHRSNILKKMQTKSSHELLLALLSLKQRES
jgi:FixJ family two-component response regulator